MSETQQSHKKNKKKKKSTSTTSTAQPKSDAVIKSDEAEKFDSSISEILPQQVGITTKFKDVEVTMTNSGNGVVNGTTTSKKKKKKKKNKQQQQPGGDNETSVNGEAENQNLLNFTDNRIELVNHPEISVTISTAPVVQAEEPPQPKEKEKSNSVPEKEEVPPATAEAPASSKKKKKKKKKKKNQEEVAPAPPSNADPPPDDAHSTPTYVKLPADGGNCVLLVSHESFSNGSKQLPNNSSSDTQSKTGTVVLKNKELKGNENTSSSNVSNQNSNSVSIFPVYSDKKPESKSEFNVSSSLSKINDMMKSESGDQPPKEDCKSDVNPASVLESDENKPTKSQLKAERRAKQEAQRAAKLAKSSDKNAQPTINEQDKKPQTTKDQPVSKPNVAQSEASPSKNVSKTSIEQEIFKKINIFSHLPRPKDLMNNQISNNNNAEIPPPIIELGSHYNKGTLCGSNARCVGFLGAVRQVILDYKTPKNKIFCKDLDSKLQIYLDYLNNCRPLSVSIINSMKFLKHHINHVPDHMSEQKAKELLCQTINNYVREEILLAKEAIAMSGSNKIANNDTILVFAYSSLVKDVLCKAHDEKKSFKVIVVDSRAKLEGLQMLHQLTKYGLHCCYISINAVSTVIKKVNKVILGAHALLANGNVMSRLGCKILSLLGSTSSVPVLVCCETYKFWERSLTDSIVHNELGNAENLATTSISRKDNTMKLNKLSSLQLYNLLYDVTPAELVSVVITEKGLIPCTSVAMILRVKQSRLHE